jgi:outer membrane protein assembly factor BamB
MVIVTMRIGALVIGLAFALLVAPAARAGDDDWPTYHRTLDRAGVAAAGQSFGTVQPSWTTGALDGAVYAEPLYVGGRVFVATENNTVYAFDASSGSGVWQTTLGDAVSAGELPCGNISPVVGITGTPTIDVDAGVLYAAALVEPLHYELYAIDTGSGEIVFHRLLDPPGLDAPSAGQRGALALQQGRVYVPFGGRYGDCGSYHGQVVAASASDPGAPLQTYTTPARETGIWAASGEAVADDGTIFVATGNGDARGSDGRTESVIALSPDLNELDVWQPSNWLELDRGDTDIGSVAPTLLPDLGLVFQSGKNGTGYLLQRNGLGGLGGEAAAARLPGNCGGVYGGIAYASPLLYLPCPNRIVALQVSANPPGVSLAWRGPDQLGRPVVGSPIVVAGAVWNIDFSARVFALDAGTGDIRFMAQLPGLPGHFATPAYGGGQVYVATGGGVAAFQLL